MLRNETGLSSCSWVMLAVTKPIQEENIIVILNLYISAQTSISPLITIKTLQYIKIVLPDLEKEQLLAQMCTSLFSFYILQIKEYKINF